MPSIDLKRLLNEPIYAMDFQFMAGDLKDFLDSSERNIELQYHLECQNIQRRAETEDFPEGFREHLQTNADHRFKVSLPLRVRYGALLGLTTSVEWGIHFLVESLREPLSTKPRNRNPTVHALSELAARTRLGKDELVQDYEALVHVRNCITHAAGIVKHFKYRDELYWAVRRLVGFSIDNWHFLGEHICIQRGALNRYIESTGQLVVTIYRACDEQGLLKNDSSRPARVRHSSDAGWTDDPGGGGSVV